MCTSRVSNTGRAAAAWRIGATFMKLGRAPATQTTRMHRDHTGRQGASDDRQELGQRVESDMTVEKQSVRQFWDSEACGERFGQDQDRLRYDLEPEILAFADFSAASGARVLEIGVGMGSDFLRWLRAGALAAGVDLTERATGIVRRRIQEEGLEADVRVADAESLPFNDGEFDLVYSWGVLHHTPDTSRAIQEARRVMKPGGRLKLMMYHRHSWVALAAWARFGLLRGKPQMKLRQAVAKVESPGTKAFTVTEAKALLQGMEDVSVRPVLTHWDHKYSAGLARLLGDRFGWFLLMQARKH